MIDVISARKRILEFAIHGNLVPNMNDESSQESVSNNIETRAKLVKQKLTKEPKVKPMITEGTFDIPNSWIWVSLGDLCILLSRGKSPKYSDNEKYPVFAQKCNQPNGLALEKALFLDETTLEKWPEYFRLRDKDIVINSTGTGTVGRVGFYVSEALSSKYPFIVPDSHVTVVRVGENIMPEYVFYALRSTSIQKIMFNQFRGSTNQKEFYIDSVYSIPIPLPPLAEQKRIVERVEEIFRLLDTIDEAQEKYSADAESLKAKVITAGIQGKLTEQLPSDGTAEELYQQIQAEKADILKQRQGRKDNSIMPVEDDVPFEIPENWKWIRFGETGFFRKGPFGSSLTKSMFVPKSEDSIRVYEQQHAIKKDSTLGTYYITKEYFIESMKGFEVLPGDIIISCAGTIGETYIMPDNIEKGIINQALMRVSVVPSIDKQFFLYYFNSQLKKSAKAGNGSAITNIPPFDVLKNLYFPLPPLAEQKRIAEVLERVAGVMG